MCRLTETRALSAQGEKRALVGNLTMPLWERKRLDLTVEAMILRPEWQALFSDVERRIAVNRLREYGYSGSLPDVAPA